MVLMVGGLSGFRLLVSQNVILRYVWSPDTDIM